MDNEDPRCWWWGAGACDSMLHSPATAKLRFIP